MDEKSLKRMEEIIDQELSKYIRPPNGEKAKIQSSISFVNAEKIHDAAPKQDWMKPFPTTSK